ncbi:MAG: MOSC domain-containing protein [Pseudomonadota bacterium]
MIVKKIFRYPVKGLPGEALNAAPLGVGAGIDGDRRFAFGIDQTVDDGVWRSSRSYLINAVNDGLLKLTLSHSDGLWTIQNTDGEVVRFKSGEQASINTANAVLAQFLSAISGLEHGPVLIDRKRFEGPKGHWDFPDSELLIVNLATVRELEGRWRMEIDPRRFRANFLVDGIPAWSEFGLYGARFSIGGAEIDFLRPARRCAATSVNPDTGDRDAEILQRLVQDYGHGFFGVYARVSRAGTVSLADTMHCVAKEALPPSQAVCEIAPDLSFWPRAAKMHRFEEHADRLTFGLSASGAWPIRAPDMSGKMKVHCGWQGAIVAEIQPTPTNELFVAVNKNDECKTNWLRNMAESRGIVFVSGPFANRQGS